MDEERPCTQQCFCRQHEVSKAFTFVVHKSSAGIDTTIYSDDLYSKLIELLDLEGLQMGAADRQKTINGLGLLKHYHTLKSLLSTLGSELPHNSTTHSLFLEMELLVDGLLADGEVFKSFGYENLYEREFLDFKLWKKFQQDKLQRDISALEEGFWAIDGDLEELSMPLVRQNSLDLQSTEAESVVDAADDFGELPGYPAHPEPNNLWPIEVEHITEQVNDFGKLPTPALQPPLLYKPGVDQQLVEAAKAGHVAVVQLLLDQGAAVDSRGYWDISLVEAAKEGHVAVVQLLLDRGAAMDGDGYRLIPLVEAAKAGHVAVVKLLLDWGAAVDGGEYMDTPLVEATREGHVAVVQLLLDRGAAVDGSRYWDTPIADAAKAGHVAVVQLLQARMESGLITAATKGRIFELQLRLDRGADINAITPCGTALSAAARAGHDPTVRWLLRKGADVHVAAIILQGFGDAEFDAEFSIASLFETASRVRNIEYTRTARRSYRYNSEKVQNLRYLHRKFVAQHILMIKASQRSSTQFRELSQRFRGYREAWSAGIRTLRNLCSGESPRYVGDTIAFLCLAKAISETLQRTSICDQSEQFLEDLDRWQVLFTSKADRDSYRDAIHSMWGVVLDENVSSPRQVDSDVLVHFQGLASTLVNQASESLGFDTLNDTGLECSQQWWQLRNNIVPSSTDSSNNIPDLHPTGGGDAQSQEIVHPQPPDPADCSTRMILRQEVEADVSSATVKPMVILLMAGAIFAIVVIFLQCWSSFRDPLIHICFSHLLT